MRGPASKAPIALPLTIEREEVLHFLGYPAGERAPERIEALLARTLAEARRLARARGVYASLAVERAGEVGLERIDATGLVIGMVTAGDGIERRAADAMDRGAATEALLLDAAGSAAAEEAADRLGAIISGDENARPRPVSCRVSPGYAHWPLASQTALFERLPHEAIGVTLLPSMLMVPRKSISFAMWLGADARPIAGLAGCARCRLEHCRYRRVSASEES
jgi:hypothetical protein